MDWLFLIAGGIFEIVWATALKYANGFSKLYPSIITVIGMIISFAFLSISLKTLPIGTAYSVWTGIGAIGTVIVGILLFGESHSIMRMIYIALVISGIVGLKLTS